MSFLIDNPIPVMYRVCGLATFGSTQSLHIVADLFTEATTPAPAAVPAPLVDPGHIDPAWEASLLAWPAFTGSFEGKIGPGSDCG